MKSLRVLAAAVALAGIAAAPVSAADLSAPIYKGPAPVYRAPAFSWTGFYLGLNGGYGFGKSDWSSATTSGSIDPQGALVGATLGYNWQIGSWVLGVETDADASWMSSSTASGTGVCAGGTGCDTHNTWLATARARVGYAWSKVMPYVTGGGAVGGIKMSPNTGGSETATELGWTAGAGVEFAYDHAWSAKLEYLYADLGAATCSASTCGVETDVTYEANIVRAGLNYRF